MLRTKNIARVRELFGVSATNRNANDASGVNADEQETITYPCPCCGGSITIIETFGRGVAPRYPPTARPGAIRIDCS
jgi:hypothetical protein